MAKNNKLVMREEEFQTLVQGLDKCSASIGTSSQTTAGKFSAATDVGMMTEIVGTINKQMNSLSTSMTNVRNFMAKHSNQMFDLDRDYAQQASGIEIPQDFLANNSTEINTYNRTILGKIDGRSVNEGETAKEFSDIDESTIAAEGLENITGQEAKEEQYDSSSIIGKSLLADISGNETQAQEYNDASSVNRTNMTDISGNETQAQEYNDASSVSKANIADISGNETQAQELDGTTIIDKSVLGNINQGNTTQEQELDTATTMAAIGLSEVPNNGSRIDAGKVYDETMAETQGLASTAFASMVSSQTSDKKKKDDEENN